MKEIKCPKCKKVIGKCFGEIDPELINAKPEHEFMCLECYEFNLSEDRKGDE
jgi:hypothetical protein